MSAGSEGHNVDEGGNRTRLISTSTIMKDPYFNVEQVADALRCALKGNNILGVGCDEAAIINLLCGINNEQRQEVIQNYKSSYGRDVDDDIKAKLGGNLESTIRALLFTPDIYDAKTMRHAMKGVGTDDQTIIEILCSRSNKQILAMKEAYTKKYQRNIEEDIKSETAGFLGLGVGEAGLQRIFISLLQGDRRPDVASVDREWAKTVANELYQAGEKAWFTDNDIFNKHLSKSSWAEIRAIDDAYTIISGYTLHKAIEKSCSGQLALAYSSIVQCAVDAPQYFANRIKTAIHGRGTDDKTLIRILVTRSEIDLALVARKYAKTYHKSLRLVCQEESGNFTEKNYEKSMLAIITPKLVELAKDQAFEFDSTFNELKIGLGWDTGRAEENAKKEGKDVSVDVDSAAVCLDANGELVAACSYNNKSILDGAITLSGDNRTGGGDGDDETLTCFLDKLPDKVKHVFFGMCIYTDGVRFSEIYNCYIQFTKANYPIVTFQAGDVAGIKRAQVLARLTRQGPNNRFALFAESMNEDARKSPELAPLMGSIVKQGLFKNDREIVKSSDKPRMISIRCFQAKGVVAADTSMMGKKSSDPFARIEAFDGKKQVKFETNVVSKSLDPVWEPSMMFIRYKNGWPCKDDFGDGKGDKIVVEVWDKDMVKNDYLGGVEFNMYDIWQPGVTKKEYKIQNVGPHAKDSLNKKGDLGTIEIQIITQYT